MILVVPHVAVLEFAPLHLVEIEAPYYCHSGCQGVQVRFSGVGVEKMAVLRWCRVELVVDNWKVGPWQSSENVTGKQLLRQSIL